MWYQASGWAMDSGVDCGRPFGIRSGGRGRRSPVRQHGLARLYGNAQGIARLGVELRGDGGPPSRHVPREREGR